MSVELYQRLLLGTPVWKSSSDKNGSTAYLTATKKLTFQSPFAFLNAGHGRRDQRSVDQSQFGGKKILFSLRNFDSVNSFKLKCTEETFPKTKALIRSFIPLWKEGLFFIRCSVFFAVISAAGMLVWYAQLKATNFVETQLLPSVCSILSEHLQRDLAFGKVRRISPLGITLSSCSIGPHGKEFSCGEVETMKLRIRPFSSLRRGKIVIDAVLFQPCALVAQKEDFSWLGIPPPSEDIPRRHHSTEEGIDYRTKTRRIAREESAVSWARQRVKAAMEAANMGYIVPSGDSASLLDEEPQGDSRLSTKSGKSGSFYCMDEEMHLKDHHCIDSNIKYSLKHADLEKSFGTRIGGTGLHSWSKMIPHFLWPKFRRKAKQKVLLKGSLSSKQRILQHSATAALAFFRGPGKFREPFSSWEAHTSDGSYEDKSNSDNTPDDIVHETSSTNIVEFVQLDSKELKSELFPEKADGILNIKERSDALSYGMPKDRNDEKHYDATRSSHLDNTLITSSEVSPLGMKNGAENHDPSMNCHDNGNNSSNSQEGIPEGPNGGDRGEVNFQVLNQKSFWSMAFKYWRSVFPFADNEILSARLADEIEKLKSSLSIKAEDLSEELVDCLNDNGSEGIERTLPITLDSVYFSGGTLMLLGYGDQEPKEMVKVDGHVRFENHYKRIHVKLGGNCMEWGQEHTSQGGGQLSADVFVDIQEQNWHANLNVLNLFAPLFEGILEIPVALPKGRASGEVHVCMSKGDSFPSLHGQIDVTGLSLFILDAPATFSELTASLCFRGQRVFLHNASGWFGDAPVEASGDFGINPEDGEFHLMCQIPCVEVNALMKTLKMRPLLFPLAGSVTAVFNCQGPLVAPVFVGSGIISRKTSQTIYAFPPSAASEAVIENKEAGAVAAFDRIPFSHVSANFTFNLDNCVADLYGIRACLIDGGEIRGAGSAWICPEGEIDETAMDVNLSGTFLLDKVLHRYLGKGVQMTQAKIGELNGETRLSGSLLRPRFDIKWAAPKAEESFGDARGEIIICHDYITVNSSSVAFDLYTKVQTSYLEDFRVHKDTVNDIGVIPLIIEGVDLDLRMRGFELTSLISSGSLDSPRTIHLKATGKIKFQGKVIKNSKIIDDNASTSGHVNDTTEKQSVDDVGARLVGDVSLSGVRLNQFMLAPQLTGSVSVSRNFMKLSATGRPDENLAVEIVGPSLFSKQEISQNRRLLSISLHKGQLRANIFYEPHTSTNLEVRNFPLDELELASLRGTIQRGELQLNFQKRRGHGMLLVLRPKFSGVLGEALDVAARWSGDVITIEKSVLEQASSKYELQGEYVLPGTRDRYPAGKEKDGLVNQGMAGHLGNIISSMGRWRMRLEVPGAELAEMLPLARLLSRSTDPAVQSRSKDLFMQNLHSSGFYSENLHDQLKAIQNQFDFLDDNILEDIYLPGLAEFRGRWNGSLNASGGGNGDTMADFNFLGEDWEWGNNKTQRVMVDGAYSNRDGLRLEKLFIQKDNATIHADGTVLGPITNLHFAVLNFPVGLVPTLVQIIESSTSDSIHYLRQWLTPLKGILHMEGDLRGSLAKPECDIQIRLLDGSVGGVDLGRAEVVASLTPSSRFLFNANFEPIVQSGHVHVQGSIPVTYVQHDLIEDTDKQLIVAGSVIQIPVWVKEIERGSQDIAEKKVIRDKIEEGWDFQLAESLKGLNWNLLDEGEVRMNADIKDGGMSLITALCPYANWLNGYADILLQVSGTIDQPLLDGSATFHRASVSSPVFRKPLTNIGGTVHVNSNRLCISSIESRVSRKGKLSLKGNLPLKSSESSASDKLDLKCEVLEVRAKNIFSGQVDSQMQISGSILQPNISGMTQLSHGEAYLPHDKGNGNGANRLISSHSVFPSADYNRWTATGHASSSFGSLTTPNNKWPQPAGKQSEADKKMEEAISKPGVDVRLNDLKLILGPELRIVYPLILNFAVSGEVELDGMAHPKYIRPKGTLTFENGDVNLVATQVRLKRDHLNVAKFEPDFGLDPILDLTLVGSEWQFRIQSRASNWQDNLVVTSTRSVDQDVLTPTEAARVFESQLAESLLENDGQLAFKKLATTTLEKLMPRIEGKGEFGQARWRLVYAPQIPSLLSVDPTVDPLKSLANNISFGTEVEVQLGKRLQASVVRKMKDSEMAMQWTFIYQLTNRLRVLFQSTPSNRLLFEYSATSQN